ncbi:MAG TPA: hypothetical protein VLA90_12420 [Actinomycetota bacterium]|nr:hypothetical protein [Actinomycetota bacterium]
MIITQDHLAAGGILFLALAMAGSVFMVFDVLFGTVTATIVAGSLVFTTRGSGTRSRCRDGSVAPVRAADRRSSRVKSRFSPP